MTENPDWTGFFTRTDPDSNNADDSPYLDDPVEGTVWLLELVITVEFLGRGDRPNLTVWDAFDEAIGWWVDERTAAIGGAPDADVAAVTDNGPDLLRNTLQRLASSIDVHPRVGADLALQQAVRRWCTSMSALHNDGERFLRTKLMASPE